MNFTTEQRAIFKENCLRSQPKDQHQEDGRNALLFLVEDCDELEQRVEALNHDLELMQTLLNRRVGSVIKEVREKHQRESEQEQKKEQRTMLASVWHPDLNPYVCTACYQLAVYYPEPECRHCHASVVFSLE